MAWQWKIRRATFRAFTEQVLPQLGNNLTVLDLGAGTGWLSHRLSELGHHPCAVDLSADDQDGLAAARHYSPNWPRIQAEFDRLPFDTATIDMAIYNASLHYSTDYAVTLTEALRVLRPEGHIIVLESPIYRLAESGSRMLAERHAMFQRLYGTRSDTIPSIEYLTWSGVNQLGQELDVTWRIVRPWYGWKQAARPWMAKLRNKREPSRFAILIGQRH